MDDVRRLWAEGKTNSRGGAPGCLVENLEEELIIPSSSLADRVARGIALLQSREVGCRALERA